MKKNAGFGFFHYFLINLLLIVLVFGSANSAYSADSGTKELPKTEGSTVTETPPPPIDENVTVQTGNEVYLDDNGISQRKVTGVGSSLANALDQLIYITSGSEGRFKEILGNLPLLFPDLYKVFVKL